jgi:hypothetical protein
LLNIGAPAEQTISILLGVLDETWNRGDADELRRYSADPLFVRRSSQTERIPLLPGKAEYYNRNVLKPQATSKKESKTTMGNKDKRKEKKKPKQPKATPKPSSPGKFGSARPSK